MTTSFDQYVRELEARMTDDERVLLDEARKRAHSILDGVKYKIDRRERVDNFVRRMIEWYGSRPQPLRQIVQLHDWPDSPLDHDGPCVEIAPRKCDNMRFTILPLCGEVWAEDKHGMRLTPNPIFGLTDTEIIAYIDSFIDKFREENA